MTQAADDTTFSMYLSLTWNDMLRRAFQLRIRSRTAAEGRAVTKKSNLRMEQLLTEFNAFTGTKNKKRLP